MPIDPRTRRARTRLLIAIGALLLPWSLFVNLWFAPRELYRPLWHGSQGLLSPALQVCLPTVLVLLVVLHRFGLRAADVGLSRRGLPKACLATLALWILLHLVAWSLLGGRFEPFDHQGKDSFLRIGDLLGQLLGNALFEEVVYRGLFLTQFILLFRARGMSPARAAWLAALCSAVLFALPHIPNRLLKDEYSGLVDVLIDQARLVLSGLFLAWVYLRTQNLWWVIGLHSVGNEPTLVLAWEPAFEPKVVVAAVVLLITALWARVDRRVPG